MARPDLLKAVCTLARSVNRWTDKETERLTRLVKYICQQKQWLFVGLSLIHISEPTRLALI
eukprot:14962509-Alexandrium_andersonii.AAC.1